MDTYKLIALLKEFSFLQEILTVCEETWRFGSPENESEMITFCRSAYGEKLWFDVNIVHDSESSHGGYIHPHYLSNPDSVQIKKADVNLFAQTPTSTSYSWSEGGYEDYTHYYAVTIIEGGDYSMKKLDVAEIWATGPGEQGESSTPTIGEQLLTKEINPDLIVCVDFQDTDANGNGSTLLTVTIHKMKDFDLAAYHHRQFKRVEAAIHAEIETACA